MDQEKLRAPRWRAIASCSLTAMTVLALSSHTASALPAAPAAIPVDTTVDSTTRLSRTVVPDSLFGRSGKLRFRLFSSSRLFALPVLERLFGGGPVPDRPGV